MLTEFTEETLTGTVKQAVIDAARAHIERMGLTIVEENVDKPWGAYFRFADGDLESFLQTYYEREAYTPQEGVSWSPKLLIMAPDGLLSWQWHERRAEVWKVVVGEVGIMLSDTDEDTEFTIHRPFDVVEISQGTRHTMQGTGNWGIVAEIWQHTESEPSEETDIIRISDKYGREGSNENI